MLANLVTIPIITHFLILRAIGKNIPSRELNCDDNMAILGPNHAQWNGNSLFSVANYRFDLFAFGAVFLLFSVN
jgi:hypothetical protein